MKTRLTLRFSTAVFVLLALVGGSMTAAAAGEDAKVAATALGKIVVDGKGMTAYFFDNDQANSGTSACAGPCAATWPAITTTTNAPTVTGITGTVGTITGVAGGKQLTINGRPIYTFANDKAPGDVNGQGVKGVWYVISPSGEEIKSTVAEVAAEVAASVATTALGKIVVDGKGMTAYFFDKDQANSGTSACAGPCVSIWPAITSTSNTPSVTGITGTIGTITGLDGGKQLTINGRPIYTFAKDKARGDVNGQGINGLWYVISPSGEEIKSTVAEVAAEAAKKVEATKMSKAIVAKKAAAAKKLAKAKKARY